MRTKFTVDGREEKCMRRQSARDDRLRYLIQPYLFKVIRPKSTSNGSHFSVRIAEFRE